MRDIRESIKKNEFTKFVQDFMKEHFHDREYPEWIVDSLKAVNINL